MQGMNIGNVRAVAMQAEQRLKSNHDRTERMYVMPIIMNMLETPQDIEDYKKWLATKSSYYLRCLIGNFKRDQQKVHPVYPNLPLRIELATKEMEKKTTSKEKILH
jgi:hypothetical protein